MTRFPQRGLYVITQAPVENAPACLSAVRAALEGGAAVVQYRAKPSLNQALAIDLLTLCRQYRVPLIINDEVELARRIGADGVHLGRDDGSLAQARERLGPDALIGISCYDSLERALTAEAGGADYVAFGRFFTSTTKPDAPVAHLETLAKARAQLGIPIVAIGGIDASNATRVLAAGATLLAVIGGVFGQADPRYAAHQLTELIARQDLCPD